MHSRRSPLARRAPSAHAAPNAPFSTPALPVTRATFRDLPCVVRLLKQNASTLGFIPRAALREKIESGRIWLVRDGCVPGAAGPIVGFLHHGSLARPEVRLFQAAVRPDARRRHVGTALVNDLLRRAADAGAAGVSLRCLSFLDANRFWAAAGFRLLATEPGGKGPLNVWVKRLGPPRARRNLDFDFHSRVHPCPGCGTPTVDTWVRGARRLRFCPACVAAAGRN
jgi:GNAT superfamily N-acetyltransferase